MTRVLGLVLKRVYQPQVIAEIIGGILLGPTLFGRIPGYTQFLFAPASTAILQVFAEMGLMFFMFIIGLELDPSLVGKKWKTSLAVSLTSVALPFVLGVAVSFYFKR